MMIEQSEKVTILETEDYNVFLRSQRQPAYPLSLETPEVKTAKDKLSRMLFSCSIVSSELLEKFNLYVFILDAQNNEISKIMENDNPPILDEFTNMLDCYTISEYDIKT